MSLMRPLTSLREEMNRLFNEMDQGFFSPSLMFGRGTPLSGQENPMMSVWNPPVDVVDNEKEVVVKAQIPGIQPENLEIEVENSSLSLSGEMMHQAETTEKGNYCRREIATGQFFRRIPLPAEVVVDKAKANFENGMLTVTLPKSQQTRRHKIKLNR